MLNKYESPFNDPSVTLQTALLNKNIHKLIDWMVVENKNVVTQASNSNWESAMIMNFLIEADKIYKNHNISNEHLKNLKLIAKNVYQWLLNNTTQEAEDNCLSWDGCTWDTGVIISSFVRAVDHFGFKVFANQNEVFKILDKMLEWLKFRTSIWEKDVKYAYGPADVAKILIAFVMIRNSKFAAHLKMTQKEMDDVIEETAKYLLRVKEERSIEDGKITYYLWSDPYQTGEVGEAFAIYRSYLIDKGANSEQTLKIEEVLRNIIRGFECTQTGGIWGSHEDTLKCLSAYLYVAHFTPGVQTEPHIVFKTLRHICDVKQNFSDGSYLHTSFLTVYYAQSIITVFNYWELSTKKMYDIYDNVFWSSTSLITTERSTNMVLGLEISRLKDKIKKTTKKISIQKAILTSIFAGLPIAIITFVISCYLGIWELDISINFDDSQVELFGIIISIALAIISGVFGITLKKERNTEE